MIQLPVSFGNRSVRVVGAGAYIPPHVVDNASIAEAIPAWPAEWIEEKTSIRERRFLWELDAATGTVLAPSATSSEPRGNSDMCEVALRRALASAGMHAQEVDALFLVTCSPDRLNFNHDAMEVHRRLGFRSDAYALVIDDGCGGTPYMIDMAYRMIRSGAIRSAAIIGSTCTSPYLNRATWTGEITPAPGRSPLNAALSMYVFGDGAGAVVLRADAAVEGAPGIVASMSGNDYQELVIRRAGGVMHRMQETTAPAEDAFVINGRLVAQSYPVYMRRCIEALLADHPELGDQVARYYFHQPNKRLMDRFVRDMGIPEARVPYNVDRYGNTSAAGMLILLAEDLEAGRVRVGGGELVMIAAVGANVHYAGQLVRL
jgi:3-oxoacyl-[acyl-carrier-protein] synthase III